MALEIRQSDAKLIIKQSMSAIRKIYFTSVAFTSKYLIVFIQSMLVISTYFGHFDAGKSADRRRRRCRKVPIGEPFLPRNHLYMDFFPGVEECAQAQKGL